MRKILLAACAALAMTGTAQGGELKDVDWAGWWRIQSGASHCVASAEFKNDTMLLFGVNADGETWMKIVNNSWKIPEGSYKVTVQVDYYDPQEFTFSSDDDGVSLMKFFELDKTAYELLTKGNALRIKTGSVETTYSLTGTASMFPKLLGCIGQVAKASNPFSTPKTAPVSTPSNPFKRT